MPSKKVTPPPAPAAPETGPGTDPSLAELARQRPGLVIGGGLLIGLLAGVLIPRGAAGKLARGAAGAAALGSEAGLALARQARDNAHRAAGEASEGARRLGHGTAAAAGNAGSAALDLARAGLNLLASLKR